MYFVKKMAYIVLENWGNRWFTKKIVIICILNNCIANNYISIICVEIIFQTDKISFNKLKKISQF